MFIRSTAVLLSASVLAGCTFTVAELVDEQPSTLPGPSVEVAPSAMLTGRATLDVSGTGFDVSKGIYVAFCVKPAPGEPPTPCAGGVDTSGEAGASAWVSSNPPPYGKGLATAYGPDGSFNVQIQASPKIGEIDCRKVVCGVATRADHTRTTDRTQDVFIPITFEER